MKAVLFDLDGTVLDTAPDFHIILNQLLSMKGKPTVTGEQVRETVSNGARALITLGFGIMPGDDKFDPLLAELLDLYSQQIPQTRARLFNGVADTIAMLDKAEVPWAIVTNKPSRFAEPLLTQFSELSSCGITVCPDHVSRSKPDPEGLLLACRKLGTKVSNSIYVGDHPRDIEAGKNARMKTAAVAWGYFSAQTDLATWNADFIATSPAELARILLQN